MRSIESKKKVKVQPLTHAHISSLAGCERTLLDAGWLRGEGKNKTKHTNTTTHARNWKRLAAWLGCAGMREMTKHVTSSRSSRSKSNCGKQAKEMTSVQQQQEGGTGKQEEAKELRKVGGIEGKREKARKQVDSRIGKLV